MRAFLITVLVVVFCGTDAHLNTPACVQISNLFQTLCSANDTPTGVSSIKPRPGKRGVPGIKGDIGPPGIPGERGQIGTVDYGNVKAIVQEELIPGNQRMDQMTSKIDELTRKIEAFERWTEICELKFENKCFWKEDQADMSYSKASEFCGKRGGRPANVYSRTHYGMMILYLRSTYGNSHCWLGMKYNPTTRSISLADGTPGPQVSDLNWHRGYPVNREPYTKMGIVSKSDLASTSQGVHDWSPSATRECVVCEM